MCKGGSSSESLCCAAGSGSVMSRSWMSLGRSARGSAEEERGERRMGEGAGREWGALCVVGCDCAC